MLNKLKDFDLYRRIPKDLTETTTHGSVLSICAAIFMLMLFVAELWAFLSVQIQTNIIIDPNTDSMLRINFNITVLDLPCEFATIDVVDVLGTRSENVTKNINKWQVDAEGLRRNYEGRNPEQPKLEHDTHHDLEQLHRNGIHAVPITDQNFEEWVSRYEYTMVNFYAPWCVWCQKFEPTWEAFAEKVSVEKVPISVVKVDCVANRAVCMNNKIQAFPLVRLFKRGEAQSPDYRKDRTVEALMEFANSQVAKHQQLDSMTVEERDAHLEREAVLKDDHPGCMMSGYLLVNRVPGNFHIEARSNYHNINPVMANLSHVVNQLSFGPLLSRNAVKKLNKIPDIYFKMESTTPMNDRYYVVNSLHQAFHHHIKVVSTNLEVSTRKVKDAILAYQMVPASQIMKFDVDETPDARFSYDISPMSVLISRKGKPFYEFITSMCALIGGTFTVVGLLTGLLSAIFKPKKL